MSPGEWERVKAIVAEALRLPAPDRVAWIRSLPNEAESVVREAVRLIDQEIDTTRSLHTDTAAAASENRMLKPGDKPLGRFEILFFLGRGGMGEVYAAFDNELREVIALKTLRSDLPDRPVYLRRLHKEVQIARRLRHDNLCRVYDTHAIPVADGDTHAVSMELLHGETLFRTCRRRILGLEEARAILEQLAAGLHAVHTAGVLHRDFKTGNVILTRDEQSRARSVITDFGLAIDVRSPADSRSVFGPHAMVGTPSYMAPEQFRGEGASVASDIYSLGVVSFEILTGRLPFAGDTNLAAALRRFDREAPSPREFRPDVPLRWALAICYCLAEDPRRRPRSALEFLQILHGNGGALKAVSRRYGRRAALLGTVALMIAASGPWPRGHPDPPPKAVAHFKLGEHYASRREQGDIGRAIDEFTQAVTIHPDYAEAWASMANAYCAAIHYGFLASKVALPKAEAAARKAIALNADLSKAHGALAYLRSVDLNTWRTAEPEFATAIRLNPNEPLCRAWHAAFLGRQGRFQEAISEASLAVNIEPGDFYFNHQLAAEYFRAQRFEEYLHQSQELVTIQNSETSAHLSLMRAHEWLGQFDEAEAQGVQADRFATNRDSHVIVQCFRATLDATRGRMNDARGGAAAVAKYWRDNPFESNLLIGLFARMGDYANAMAVLNRAWNMGDSSLLACPTNPYLRQMRALPAYQEFLRRLGF